MYGGGAEAMLKDIGTVNRDIRERFPELSLILMGHSMGSLAVRAFAGKHDDCMDMLIVCGSPSKNAARPLGKQSHMWRNVSSAPVIRAKYWRRFPSEAMLHVSGTKKDKNAWVCSDAEAYKAYGESDLCGFTFTDDAYLALFGLMKEAYDVKNWRCTNPKLPVLFVSGAEDPCMGNVRQFAKAVQAMRSAGYLDVKGKLYPGMRHEILNEKEKERVYHDLAVYMKQKGF